MNRSNSSSSEVSVLEKCKYNFELFILRLSNNHDSEFDRALNDIKSYASTYNQVTGRDLSHGRVLEIGFGARPFRSFVMQSFCKELVAVDLDRPAFQLKQCFRILRENGFERALKTFVRLALFDKRMWRSFHKWAKSKLSSYAPEKIKFVTMDVSSPEFWKQNEGPYDLIYSEDVFEHIPAASLDAVIDLMCDRLSRNGVCIVKPFVFTGISGGHNIDAYPRNLSKMKPDRAWGHLCDREFRVNTYLNRLSRREFRAKFERRFNVTRDFAVFGRLGEEFMTAERRAKLKSYDDYELFSNKVEFILTPREMT